MASRICEPNIVLFIHRPALLFGARSTIMTIVSEQIALITSPLQITKVLLQLQKLNANSKQFH